MSDIEIQSKLPSATSEKHSAAFSIVWIIPLIAAVIGGWLVFKNITDESTTVEVTFQQAHGIEKGKTFVKYRDIKIGQVKDIRFSNDLSHVIVVLQIDGLNASQLTESSRFWVVKPRVGTTGVSGLETLMSGAYIELDPGEGSSVSREFAGLEEPPQNYLDSKGTIYIIQADSLGSLTVGSPVHYRGLTVGEVIKYNLAEDRSHMDIKIFIDAPHDQFIRHNTRFWNTSGVEVEVGTDGVKMDVESMIALFAGGISFNTPESIGENVQASDDTIFTLFKTEKPEIGELISFTVPFLMYFSESVRGLSVGSPVEFGGIRVGSVADISFEADLDSNQIRIPVLIKLEPDRIPFKQQKNWKNNSQRAQGTIKFIKMLVRKGMRAQLQNVNMLTGQLSIVIDMYPDAEEVSLREESGYMIVPTVPSKLTNLTTKINNLLNKVDALPLTAIAKNLEETTAGANKLFNDKNIAASIANLNAALEKTNKLIESTNADEGGTLGIQARTTMEELAKAARSLRAMAEYLERHPESLLTGKRSR